MLIDTPQCGPTCARQALASSSINTRWAGSRKPCSRIQRRRARATSARFRSAARRLFFNGDAMASKKSGKCADRYSNLPILNLSSYQTACSIERKKEVARPLLARLDSEDSPRYARSRRKQTLGRWTTIRVLTLIRQKPDRDPGRVAVRLPQAGDESRLTQSALCACRARQHDRAPMFLQAGTPGPCPQPAEADISGPQGKIRGSTPCKANCPGRGCHTAG